MRRLLHADVWTNVAYPLAGFVPYYLNPGPMSIVFALLMTLMGAGSFWYHFIDHTPHDYPLPKWVTWGNHADVLGMYGVVGFILITATGVGGIVAAVIGAAVSVGAGFYWRFELDYVPMEQKIGVLYVGALIVAAMSSIYRDPNFPIIGASIVFMIVALAMRFIPESSRFYRPWLHGGWHLLTAPGLSLYFLGVA